MPLALIVLLGFILRLFQLGADNFWIDEIGVAQAARLDTAAETLAAAHSHVMAMPLDYLAAWLFARFGTSEAWLRLPAALWGTAALPAAYVLFRRLSNRRTALAAVLLLALSPLHIQYSQELRFYSALVFFYLLATGLLLAAIQSGQARAWIVFCLAAGVGILFHVYVLLAVLTGAAWLWITYGRDPSYADARRYYLRSASFLLAVFLAAVVAFGGVNTAVEIPLFVRETPFDVFSVGLGWAPFYRTQPIAPWIFGGLCFLGALVGMVFVIFSESRGLKAALLCSLMVQIGVVVLMNVLKNYFLAPRQFLFALPVLLLFTGEGIEVLAAWISRRSNRWDRPFQGVWAAALLLVGLSAIPALQNYYAGDKGLIREITRLAVDAWKPGDSVLVIPDYEAATYVYYGDDAAGSHEFYRRLQPAQWSSLAEAVGAGGRGFLIAHYPLEPDQAELVKALALDVLYVPTPISRYSHAVWTWGKAE